MRIASAFSAAVLVLLVSQATASAQSAQDPSVSVPRLIHITGAFRPADGQPPASVETVTLSVYADAEGGAPVWQETQTVALDNQGRYSLLLGASHPDGIPAAVFAATSPQWLGTRFERPAEVEGPRVRLTSVPYALRASDADTLGGRPASDYVVAPTPGTSASRAAGSQDASVTAPADVLPGTANVLAKYVDAANVGPSALYESGGFFGVGTSAPLDNLHVRFTNTNGGLTGFAVQNLGNTTTSYSGMLFYDQNNQLGQFQGFNNVTHEYRINNIARNGASVFDGSINFMTGSTSRFFVASNGNVGIGTTFPSTANLEVSNALNPTGVTNLITTTFSANSFASDLIGRKARGTGAAPTAVLNNDGLLDLSANGYGTTGFGASNAAIISMRASENWTDTAHGTVINFSTTANGTTTPSTRMTIGPSGNVGIGTFSAASLFEVNNGASTQPFAQVTATTFGTGAGSGFLGRRARGTAVAPSAVLNGDLLVAFLGRGYATTNFANGGGGLLVRATENWTDAANGTAMNFNTTTNGTNVQGTRMTITQSGDIGMGTMTPSAPLEIVRQQGDSFVLTTAYNSSGSEPSAGFVAQGARGTLAAPAAVQTGDLLGIYGMSGFGTTQFGDFQAGIASAAMENWTDTARGSVVGILATPIGQVEPQVYIAVLPNGNVGIDTPMDVNGIPTALETLQVFGDIRVGTTGTNGCIKNFAGTGILGTCSSDRRLKKDITPFAPALDKLTALQPVNYFWRANEFPDRHFGNSLNYGLIAQDVERVLPDLVVTEADGFKAVDYTKIPLLTIQAVKELKTNNDALKAENDGLKQRVAALEPLAQRVEELERLVAEMLAKK